eukprot:scaffold433215_cov17-Prasinocladus_malaysianus.AAC.1
MPIQANNELCFRFDELPGQTVNGIVWDEVGMDGILERYMMNASLVTLNEVMARGDQILQHNRQRRAELSDVSQGAMKWH